MWQSRAKPKPLAIGLTQVSLACRPLVISFPAFASDKFIWSRAFYRLAYLFPRAFHLLVDLFPRFSSVDLFLSLAFHRLVYMFSRGFHGWISFSFFPVPVICWLICFPALSSVGFFVPALFIDRFIHFPSLASDNMFFHARLLLFCDYTCSYYFWSPYCYFFCVL